MKLPVGGFFELELNSSNHNYHKQAAGFLTSGRSSLNLILKELDVKKLYVPYYSCDSILMPIEANRVEIEYYRINYSLEIDDEIRLDDGEYLLVINYFGLKSSYCKQLCNKLNQVIIDNTQAFFFQDEDYVSFNSARKFFGVSDGSYFYLKNLGTSPDGFIRNSEINTAFLIKRLEGKQEDAFNCFKEAERNIQGSIMRGSLFSERILNSLNYDEIRKRRIENFLYLNERLSEYNKLKFKPENEEVPFCYPFYSKKMIDREEVLKRNVFFPKLWPEVLSNNRGYDVEYNLSENMFALPVDQRYGQDEMNYIVNTIIDILNA